VEDSKVRARASAPGKVILFGEHFVVRGKPAIVSALSLRAHVSVLRDRSLNGCIRILSREYGGFTFCREEDAKASTHLAPYYQLARSLGIEGDCEVRIESEIPPGSGLGSSASTSVALTAAALKARGLELCGRELIEKAMLGERAFHGKPSGIDVVAAVEGGFVLFYSLDRYHKLTSRVGIDDVVFLIVDTGVPRRTRDAVLGVLERYERHPGLFKKVYDAAEELVMEAVSCLKRGDYVCLGELMLANHGLLSSIGVSFLEAEKVVHTARMHGALGGKITGAGMGGSVVLIVEASKEERVRREVLKEVPGARVFRALPESRGVSVD